MRLSSDPQIRANKMRVTPKSHPRVEGCVCLLFPPDAMWTRPRHEPTTPVCISTAFQTLGNGRGVYRECHADLRGPRTRAVEQPSCATSDLSQQPPGFPEAPEPLTPRGHRANREAETRPPSHSQLTSGARVEGRGDWILGSDQSLFPSC